LKSFSRKKPGGRPARPPNKKIKKNFPRSAGGRGRKKNKKEVMMEIIMEKIIPGRMGAFGGVKCAIFFDKKKNKIFCDRIKNDECDMYECDMSQLGWGSTAVCPLLGFSIDLNDRIALLKWWEYLISLNDKCLKEIAKFLQEKYLKIKCDVCGREIKAAFNLLHYSKKNIVCDDCFNHADVDLVNKLLFSS
jgi:hypothetical protein